jgi:hypothetical protein
MNPKRALLAFLVAGAAMGGFAACASTAPTAAPAGPGDATVDGGDAGPAGGDATAIEDVGDADAWPDVVVILPCSVGRAFLTCAIDDAGGTWLCTSDTPMCGSCDDAGCDNVWDAGCVDQCGADQVGMGCGGNPPPPGYLEAAAYVRFVYADPPDACSIAPRGDLLTATTFYCCPSAIVDP